MSLKSYSKAAIDDSSRDDITDPVLTNTVTDHLKGWEQVKLVLKGQLKDISYRTWIELTSVIVSGRVNITISVPL